MSIYIWNDYIAAETDLAFTRTTTEKGKKHVTSTAATGKTNDYLQSRHSALNYRSGEKIKSTLTQLSDPGRTGKKIIF